MEGLPHNDLLWARKQTTVPSSSLLNRWPEVIDTRHHSGLIVQWLMHYFKNFWINIMQAHLIWRILRRLQHFPFNCISSACQCHKLSLPKHSKHRGMHSPYSYSGNVPRMWCHNYTVTAPQPRPLAGLMQTCGGRHRGDSGYLWEQSTIAYHISTVYIAVIVRCLNIEHLCFGSILKFSIS